MSGSPRRWSVADLPLILNAGAVVLFYRVMLSIVPVRRLTGRVDQIPLGQGGEVDPLWVGRAVTAVARRIPGATCLPRALAAQHLLRRRGIATDLHFGVADDRAGKFIAHAWLTRGEQTIIGEVSGVLYTRLRPTARPHPEGT